MLRRTATIDTSCLIALNYLRLLDKLSVLFDTVHVPKAVRQEMSKRGGPRKEIHGVLRRFTFYEKCDAGDPLRVKLLLIETGNPAKPKKDLGEAEAVIQATEVGATMVIVDDPIGRSWAERHSLEPHGLIWILRSLREIDAIPQLKPYIRKLQSKGYRLPAKDVRILLHEFQED